MASRGVVYTAFGTRFVDEARVSAGSVRRHLPHLPIVLFTDGDAKTGHEFDDVRHLPERVGRPHIDKLVGLRATPFDETLFLDCDTYLVDDVSGLFDLLSDFDLAMALERRYHDYLPPQDATPPEFPEFNQGVVVVRMTSDVAGTIESAVSDARLRSARSEHVDDQTVWRPALYSSTVRIGVLTTEYNCRFHTFGHLNGRVRILHGRVPGRPQRAADLDRVAERLNAVPVPRVFAGGRVWPLVSSPGGLEPFVAGRGRTMFPFRSFQAVNLIRHGVGVVGRDGARGIATGIRRVLFGSRTVDGGHTGPAQGTGPGPAAR